MPTIAASPNPVAPGQVITVVGSGFDARRRIQVSLNGVGWTSNQVRSTKAGKFEIGIPSGHALGTFPVAARDATTQVVLASTNVTVEDVAPPPVIVPGTDRPIGELKALLDAAPSGSVVEVPDGQYHERQTIIVSKPLTINFRGSVSSDGTLDELIKFQAAGVWNGLNAIGAKPATWTGDPRNSGVFQKGYVEVNAPGSLLDLSIDGGAYAGLRLWFAGAVKVGVKEIKNAAVLGIIGWDSIGGRLLAGGQVHHCGAKGNPGDEAGGIKIGGSADGHALNFDIGAVEVHHNAGKGAWYDVYAKGSGFTGTISHHNGQNGIMVEIQDGYYVRNCKAWEDGWAIASEPWWGGSILVSSSGNGVVEGNTVAWSVSPIICAGQARSAVRDGAALPDKVNGYGNVVRNNLVAYSPHPNATKRPVNAWTDYPGSPMNIEDANTRNSYQQSNLVATSAQLAAAGIPTSPEAH